MEEKKELNNEKINDFSPENALKTKNAFLNSGISPLILGTSISFHDEACFDKNLSDGMRSLQIASRIGFLGIRVFGNSIVGDEKECIRRVCSGIKELCRFAEPLNISVLLEVHGDFNTLERILPIVDHCRDSKAFGLIWDVCHTNSAYSDDWKRFYDPLAPYIRHIHLKDVKGGKHVFPFE